jgi:Tol biopolymer transport system component
LDGQASFDPTLVFGAKRLRTGCAVVVFAGLLALSGSTARATFPGPAGGPLVFLRGTPSRVWMINSHGNGLRQLTGSAGLRSISPIGLALAPLHGGVVNPYGDYFTFAARPATRFSVYEGQPNPFKVRLLRGNSDTPSFTRNGGLLFAAPLAHTTEQTAIFLLRRPGVAARRLTSPPTGSADDYPSWSINNELAFVRSRPTPCGLTRDVFVASSSGLASPMQLTYDGMTSDPDWSPDGTRIAVDSTARAAASSFCRAATGTASVVEVMNSAGSDRRVVATGSHPTWSPDGRFLTLDRAGTIYIVGANGSGLRRLTRGSHPVWAYAGWGKRRPRSPHHRPRPPHYRPGPPRHRSGGRFCTKIRRKWVCISWGQWRASKPLSS